MNKFLYAFILVLVCASCSAQNVTTTVVEKDVVVENNDKPKLVVAIVVDQMRYDYLTRFKSNYGEGGFNRLINKGFNYKNNHFNYIPTKTGPGHASIFTGTTPKYHGIIGNDWFDKSLGLNVNCVQDNDVASVGTISDGGKFSPSRMLTTTFADENRLFTQMKGKTIGVSLKNRGAILPAGHTANAAYWFHGKDEGNWVTSSFYVNELPKWVADFNDSNVTESYFKEWNTLYDIDTYKESGSDLNVFEGGFKGKETATFPYDINALKKDNKNYDIISQTPYGNSLTTDFALAAIEGEQLGQDDFTDVLTVSYSSTDKIGHNFGVNSKEVQDAYLRLDLELERLLNALDNKVGKDEYTVFLTADHGAPDVPAYLKSVKIPSGLFDLTKMKDELNEYLLNKYGVESLIISGLNNQIFFDYKKVYENEISLSKLKNEVSLKLLEYKLIDKVFVTSEINQLMIGNGYVEDLLGNGFNQKRSGDILFVFNPAVFKDTHWNRTGTDHHSGLSYDTHVPLLFFGKGINQGSSFEKTTITQIAPTISALLGISFPNGATGQPLIEVLD